MNEITNKDIEQAYNIPDNRKIIEKAASHFVTLIPKDELQNCKLIGLWNTLRKFNPHRGKFLTYLYNNVCWQCLHVIKSNNRKFITSSNIEIGISAYKEQFSELIEGLTDELQTILSQRFEYGMTYREIGKIHGYSRETARKKLQKAVAILKQKKIDILS